MDVCGVHTPHTSIFFGIHRPRLEAWDDGLNKYLNLFVNKKLAPSGHYDTQGH